MKRLPERSTRRNARGLLPAVIVLAAGLVAAPSMASAGGHKHHKHHGHHKHHHHGGSHGYAHGPRYKTVPRVIHLASPGYYSPYLVGRAYYAPHHHHHSRYRFPVLVNGAVVYRSYNYCGDNLFVAGRYANDKGARDVLWAPGQNR